MPHANINILPGPTIQVVPVTNPAAGQPIVYTVPAGHAQSVLGITCTLTTSSGNTGNRYPQITLETSDPYSLFANVVGDSGYLIRSQSAPFIFNSNGDLGGDGTAVPSNVQVPSEIVIPPGGTITITATNLDVADQFSAIVVETLDYIAM